MKIPLTIGLAVALVASATIASAQSRGRQAQNHGVAPGYGAATFQPPIAVLLDTDKNGILTIDEMAASSGTLRELDRNADGKLTIEEICMGFGPGKGQCVAEGAPAQRRGFRHQQSAGHAPLLMVLFDTDKDGVISAAEVEQAPFALAALDLNQDEKITPDEIRPRAGARDGSGRRGNGNGNRWGAR